MPKAYWIARIDVTGAETYKAYASGASAAIQHQAARAHRLPAATAEIVIVEGVEP